MSNKTLTVISLAIQGLAALAVGAIEIVKSKRDTQEAVNEYLKSNRDK